MSDAINVHDAKTHFSRLLQRVGAGETVVLARSGRPVARLAPIAVAGRVRELGRHRRDLEVPAVLPAALEVATGPADGPTARGARGGSSGGRS